MRKSLLSLLLLMLTVFILTSAPAMAGGGKADAKIAGNLNFTDKTVYFLDHTSSPTEGNWITLGSRNEGTRIQLPEPIKLTYNGPKYKEFGGVSGTLNKDKGESYTIKYPSTAAYTTHPVYLPEEKVKMSFYGDSHLKGKEVNIYLFKLNSKRAYGFLDSFLAGDIGSLNTLFEENVDGEYEKYRATLNDCGDLVDYNLGKLGAGQYCIVMIQQNNKENLTVLSSTAFVVAEYKLSIKSPSSIIKGEDLDINMALEGASKGDKYTYGAVLIREQAYKANIEINSDGTKAGTSIIVNELDLIKEFDINSSNYRSKLTRNELQTEIQTLIGEGKGAIAIGDAGQERLSVTAFDLPVGDYYLLVGAYSPEKGLVGLAQSKVKIESKGNSKSKNAKNNDNKKEASESANNIKAKDSCQQFVSNGKRIKFEFKNGVTPIGYIQFNSKRTAGTITAVIEELKGKSSLASTAPEGEIYKHLNIQVGGGFVDSNNIGNAIIGFTVSKEWITENHINTDTIILQHFDGTRWDPLKTYKIGEDNKYAYFEAETPSFSPFAITASKNILEIVEKPGENGEMSTSEIGPKDKPGLILESEMPSQEKGNSSSKITSFFIGFLVIIFMGTAIKKKAGKK